MKIPRTSTSVALKLCRPNPKSVLIKMLLRLSSFKNSLQGWGLATWVEETLLGSAVKRHVP
jgi:hypothetical protein